MSITSPRIAVALSTYNGERYLEEQVDSILAQDVSDLRLFVRDDGSTDGTVALLRRLERREDITLLIGKNVGYTRSFLHIVRSIPRSFDYISFSDQDDIWLPGKLSRAVSVLRQQDESIPQLYCAEYEYCDVDLRPKGRSRLNRTGVTFSKMLYENVTSGNTQVMNRRLADAINSSDARDAFGHDWWVALVATALGRLSYDDFVCLKYRRTGDNASASGTDRLRVLRNRIDRFVRGGQLRCVSAMLKKLDACFGDQMAPERRKVLKLFLEGSRTRKALAPLRLRQSLRGELVVRLLFLLGAL